MSITKGKWEIGTFNYPDSGAIGRCEIRQDMGILAHVYLPAKNRSGFNEGRANAHLIAAAPDLLEACKEDLKLLEQLHNSSRRPQPTVMANAIINSEAAISKAKEGGE